MNDEIRDHLGHMYELAGAALLRRWGGLRGTNRHHPHGNYEHCGAFSLLRLEEQLFDLHLSHPIEDFRHTPSQRDLASSAIYSAPTMRIGAPFLLAALPACSADVCEALDPAVEIAIVFADRSLAPTVHELFVELHAAQVTWVRSFAVTTELADGATSLVVHIDPAPDGPFDVAVAVTARGGAGQEIAVGTASIEASPNGCNQLRVDLLFRGRSDGGVEDLGGRMDTSAIEDAETDAGAADGDPRQTDTGAPPAELVFITPPQAIPAGMCSQVVELEARDSAGREARVPIDLAITLSAAPQLGFTFYSDAACTSARNVVFMAEGSAHAAFYFRGSTPSEVEVIARAGFDETAQLQTIVGVCEASCDACEGGCCAKLCLQTDCSLRCDRANCPCTADCDSTQGRCDVACERGATCSINCEGVNDCRARCTGESDCSIDCTAANNCDEVRCSTGAECILFCDGANNCGFEECPGGSQSCPGAVVVCGRDCP